MHSTTGNVHDWNFSFAAATRLPDRAGWRFTTVPERQLWIELPGTAAELVTAGEDTSEYRIAGQAVNGTIHYRRNSVSGAVLYGSIQLRNSGRSAVSQTVFLRLGGLGNAYTPAGASENGLAQIGQSDACVLLCDNDTANWVVEEDGAGLEVQLEIAGGGEHVLRFVYTHASGSCIAAAKAATAQAEIALAESGD